MKTPLKLLTKIGIRIINSYPKYNYDPQKDKFIAQTIYTVKGSMKPFTTLSGLEKYYNGKVF